MRGGTSQDLKTGFLVGATPSKQQIALIIGAMASVFVIGGTLKLMNRGLGRIQAGANQRRYRQSARRRAGGKSQLTLYQGRTYTLINALGSDVVPDGKYLYDPDTRRVEIQWVQGHRQR